jgi:iron complex outermembrane receptor protein
MPGASAWAQAQGESPRIEETVIVTGVRGAPRTVIDSPTPIDVLGAAEIERVGRAGTLQALSTLAPSFTVPTRAGGGTASVISTGGLRGLNPDQTLILVNGKRRHKSSLINAVSALYLGSVPVDLDMIATSAIGRIEVLRDGAAAQYGSDAIAGVINIILKDDPDGGAASATWSQNFDRSDGQVVQGSANYGFPIMDDGYLHIAVSGKAQKQSNRALPLPTTLPIFRPGDPRESTVNRTIFGTYGQYPQEGLNTALNLAIPMDGDMELYSFATFSVRESRLPFTVRLNNSDRTTGSNTALPEVYPNGFVPTQVIDETDYDLAMGLKGLAAGWDWDISAVWGGNIADQTSVNNINASFGPTSPRSFVIGSLASSDLTVSADFTRAWQTAMGELQTSFGLQARRETYSVKQGDPLGYLTGSYVIPAGQPFAGQRPPGGAQATPSFRPEDEVNAERGNGAVYAELGLTPNDRFFIGVAGRYESYDDASGETLTGKLNARYELTDAIAVRAAFSNGFRAPSLAQQFYASTTNQFRTVNGVPNVALLIKTLPVGSPEAIALGADPLTPEESINTSIGVTFNPFPALSVTLDAYRIGVDDRITVTSTLAGVDAAGRFTPISAILVRNGLNPNLSAQYFTNAVDTRTEGFDIVASYRQTFDRFGVVRWSLAYNFNETELRRVKPNPPELAPLGPEFVLFNRSSVNNLTEGTPKDKIVLGANWDISRFSTSLRVSRFGEFTVPSTVVANDRTYSAKWIVDAEVSVDLTERVALAVGANNLGNEYPDAIGIFNANLGIGQYPTSSPFGFTGGSYYARLSTTF